jgi:hypothetical protein
MGGRTSLRIFALAVCQQRLNFWAFVNINIFNLSFLKLARGPHVAHSVVVYTDNGCYCGNVARSATLDNRICQYKQLKGLVESTFRGANVIAILCLIFCSP